MAERYRRVNRDQPMLLPPDMREWLPADHLVWLVIRVVEQHLDTCGFRAGRNTGGAGTAGYDPDMLLTVLVRAYAHQVTSSRRIERLCQAGVAFKVICGGSTPRHVTISEFRAGFPVLAAEFFGQVLILCARLGMGQLGVVTLDGTQQESDNSKNRGVREWLSTRWAGVAAHGWAGVAAHGMGGSGPSRMGGSGCAVGGSRPPVPLLPAAAQSDAARSAGARAASGVGHNPC